MSSYSVILHKRSITPGHIPPLSSLSIGEVAINIPDQKLYTKSLSSNHIVFESNIHNAFTFQQSTSSAAFRYGVNNTVSHNNTFVLGSNITTVSADYTYVNNISATQDVRANVVIANSISDTQGGSLVRKKMFPIIGDGLSQQFTLNHNFNTYGILIQVYDYDTKETVICYSKNVDLNNTLINTGTTLNAGVTGYLVVLFS
jgi:hypothetical protein